MNEAKEKNGGPEAKPTNKKKKQGAQVKIHKGKKKSIKKNSDATPVFGGFVYLSAAKRKPPEYAQFPYYWGRAPCLQNG